jgi:hypothetical protein
VSDASENLDKRRNRVLDPDLQNSFLGGVNEGRPAEDAIGKPADDPAWVVEITGTPYDDATYTPVQKVGEVLVLVQKALVNGGSVTVRPVDEVDPPVAAADDIIDAEVIED